MKNDTSKANLYMCAPESLIIITDKKDPLYDDRVKLKVEENMVLNIIHHGILQNVRCVYRGNKRIVVTGRQRVKAAIEANKRLLKEGSVLIRVPVVMAVGDEITQYGVMISENELRRDDSPIAKAEKCCKYLSMGRTTKEAAVAFGVTEQTIKNWMEITGLAVSVKKSVDKGVISATAAAKLSKLSPTKQKETVAEMAAVSGKKRITISAVTGSKMRKKKEISDMLSLIDEPWVVATIKWVLGESESIEV